MTPETVVLIISIVLVAIFVFSFIYMRLPKKLNKKKYNEKWKKIQKHCADKNQWSQAIIEADELLDKVLKKKKVKGVSMGERLVSAQKNFTDNDAVWYAHKLKKKIEANGSGYVPKKDEVLKALSGIRQGLRDMGVLK